MTALRRTGSVEEAQHVEQRHEEHQLAVKLAPNGVLLVGRVQQEAVHGADTQASSSASASAPVAVFSLPSSPPGGR